ncbi:hypothetical protein FA10DRAFT_267478 [Acaromyces ingoldii]|uniref:Uncharacterized protein n=1 Tax=Acaromyces ingoldii TaxID=215250 RepID=A0A316YH11_9BASI|nr:hypothetical protein FA10DRAFT_267478 [Acaromyces ingoldii]PWN88830.1 hypothetical protein FA10DRAFT_267478 [Acaromyces ingoldii]
MAALPDERQGLIRTVSQSRTDAKPLSSPARLIIFDKEVRAPLAERRGLPNDSFRHARSRVTKSKATEDPLRWAALCQPR